MNTFYTIILLWHLIGLFMMTALSSLLSESNTPQRAFILLFTGPLYSVIYLIAILIGKFFNFLGKF